jgi:hypothetical protein
MTLDEVAGSLPNGFHDAELRAVTIDFVKREARLSLDIWIGDDDDREAYRRAELTLTGLIFWIVEPPDARYPYGQADHLIIDMGSVASLPREKQPTLPPIPESAFSNWLFVVEWNAFIYVAAEDADLIWQGERTVRRFDDA